MARINVPFTVKQQHITQPTREVIVAGGQKYFHAVFTLCDKWEDVDNLKAVFVRENVQKLIELEMTDNGYECEIPWEVMADKGSFQVGIFGGDRLLTDYAYVIVKQGCVVEGESPKAPTPDWFSKMEEDVKDAKEATDSIGEMSKSIDEISSQTKIIKSDVEGIQQQILNEAHFRGYLSTNAKIQALPATPNDFAYSAESGTKWVYDETEGWTDTGTPVPDQLTPSSDTTPLMNGEASVGEEEAYARGDHRHPTDTTRASVVELNKVKDNVEKLNVYTNDHGDVEHLSHTIERNTVNSFGVVTQSIDVTIDENISIDFLSALYFTTPSVIPENYSTFPDDVHFKGDCTDEDKFIPEANTRYTIVFDYDGYSVNAYVSGVGV